MQTQSWIFFKAFMPVLVLLAPIGSVVQTKLDSQAQTWLMSCIALGNFVMVWSIVISQDYFLVFESVVATINWMSVSAVIAVGGTILSSNKGSF